jgi:L-2,4-diaminobutyrate decarboxylase
MGLVLYGMLRTMGRAPFARYVERQVDATARFAERVAAAPDFELAVAPQCNILCFRYVGPGGDLDARQDAVRARVNAGGRFFVGRTVLDGRTWLRTTVSNPETEDADLDALLDAIRDAALRTPRSASP